MEEVIKGRRVGVECKRMDAPTLTPAMRIALEALRFDLGSPQERLRVFRKLQGSEVDGEPT